MLHASPNVIQNYSKRGTLRLQATTSLGKVLQVNMKDVFNLKKGEYLTDMTVIKEVKHGV